MRLRVENLGPIREAELDLTPPLTVLTGPNNMGKTWFAWTTYALMRAARTTAFTVPVDLRLGTARPEVTIALEDFVPLVNDRVAATATVVEESLSDVFAAGRAFFKNTRLRWEFAPAAVDWGRNGAKPSPIAVTVHHANTVVHGEWQLSTRSMKLVLQSAARVKANVLEAPAEDEASVAAAQAHAMSSLYDQCFDVPRRTVLFPAERLAVNLFARELAASRTELVEEALEANEHGQDPASIIRRAGRFPLPIRDSLSTATRLDRFGRQETTFADLALDLERSLLGGAVRANDRGELHFAPHAADVSLPVHMSASIVKSLASLTFYFRHLATKGAFLIIDEPELNLHPDAQRKVARFLGKVINRGFRVMISTHSDFVVRELSHLVMMGSAGDAGLAVARELGYDADSLLTVDKVGAWLFNEGTATRIPVDEAGFGVRTIDDEISRMNADSQRLYARLVG